MLLFFRPAGEDWGMTPSPRVIGDLLSTAPFLQREAASSIGGWVEKFTAFPWRLCCYLRAGHGSSTPTPRDKDELDGKKAASQ